MRVPTQALARLDQLLYLDLSDNFMSGSLPPELLTMTQLQARSCRRQGLSQTHHLVGLDGI